MVRFLQSLFHLVVKGHWPYYESEMIPCSECEEEYWAKEWLKIEKEIVRIREEQHIEEEPFGYDIGSRP